MVSVPGSTICVEEQPVKVQVLERPPSTCRVIPLRSLITASVSHVAPPSSAKVLADVTVQPQRESTLCEVSVCR